MFERFTHEAREAVIATQDVARETGTRTIDTRHLALVLADRAGPARDALAAVGVDPRRIAEDLARELSGDGLDADALAGLGIDLEAVRSAADRTFGAGALDRARRRSTRRQGFGKDARKALELALREALRQRDRRIDGGHLLLGVLRASCPGRDALVRAGVDVDDLRAAVEGRSAA
ncbi:Clp protease N-terminal domain-containing protein [Aeromicrobium sp. 179-A 4D2 NHS]|uniref:Clp protease N-terminal domain-containing protein n=1 Tax=Aeromicrobium sp. 179-A 4D2 NHS TaxID=3142375 RepID=UPI0039A20737